MQARFFFLLLTIFSLNLAIPTTLFAHAGVDHGDNCFVDIGGFTLQK
jgi:hypothetical protein